MIESLGNIEPITIIFILWAASFIALAISVAFDLTRCHKNLKELKKDQDKNGEFYPRIALTFDFTTVIIWL